MNFHVSKIKFYACNFKQVLHTLYKLNITRTRQHENTFAKAFRLIPGCQTCMRNRVLIMRILIRIRIRMRKRVLIMRILIPHAQTGINYAHTDTHTDTHAQTGTN